MCGIIGYYGKKDVNEVLISGLKKLEYRGYDSAGIAIFDGKKFERLRAKNVSSLKEKIKKNPIKSFFGLGHTRWATHGVPSEKNAHPHCEKGVYIVHNGIIENYSSLKKELIQKGHKFNSDTDSELLAHLISNELKKTKDFLSAVTESISQIEGAYSVLCTSEEHPYQMIAFKKGPPLILGFNKDHLLVSSDRLSLFDYVDSYINLEDNEICFIDKDKYEVYDLKKNLVDKKIHKLEKKQNFSGKQGYEHYMLKEIFEQPKVLFDSINYYLNSKDHSINLHSLGFSRAHFNDDLDLKKDQKISDELLKQTNKIFILACGSSYHAALFGKYLIEDLAEVSVEVDIASEFLYRKKILKPDDLVLLISQSGETADTLSVLKELKKRSIKVLSLTNTPNSSIDRYSDGHLYMNAGIEVGVASTKSFTCSISILYLFSYYLAVLKKKKNKEEEKDFVRSLLSIPSYLESVLNYNHFFSKTADFLKKYNAFLYIGRKLHYPIALEGALKLKEISYTHAEAFPAGELKHGPLALVDENKCVIVFNPQDDLYKKTLSNLEEVRSRGGKIICLGTEGDKNLEKLSDYFLKLPKTKDIFYPFLELIPIQLLAYHLARVLGHSIDQPRNLAKSVTVE